MRYLVDSDWLIDAIGGVPEAVQTLDHLSPQGLAASIIAVSEVYEGGFPIQKPPSRYFVHPCKITPLCR